MRLGRGRVPLQIVNIQEEPSVQACTSAGLKAVLIPAASREIEKDFIVYEKMPLVVSAERPVQPDPVAVPNRCSRISDELLEAIPVRYGKPPEVKRRRERNQWNMNQHGTRRQVRKQIATRQSQVRRSKGKSAVIPVAASCGFGKPVSTRVSKGTRKSSLPHAAVRSTSFHI